MKLNDMFPSSYLKKEDVTQPVTGVIDSVTLQDLKADGEDETKPVIHFRGTLKPLILNKGNAITLSESFGDDTERWVGRTIEVFSDPSVMFGGKRVGGLRVRVPAQSAPAAAPASEPTWDFSDGRKGGITRSRQTTQQVCDFLAERLSDGLALSDIRVRPAGSSESPVNADLWLAKHGAPAEPIDDIPW